MLSTQYYVPVHSYLVLILIDWSFRTPWVNEIG